MKKTGGTFNYDGMKTEIASLKERLNDSNLWNDHKLMAKLNSEAAALERDMEAWQKMEKRLDDALEISKMAEEETDPDMEREIEDEYRAISQELDEMEMILMFSGENDRGNAFVNIHPGAGGTESMDWASMLFRMYQRWAERHRFQVDVVNEEPGPEAGIKDATLFIKGKYAFGYLSAENGIHRLVRLSPFNANNKRQTSFCAVSVSPEVNDNIEIEIDEKDIRIDTFRASGAGGQHVNKTSSAIRITHIPTGIVVSCQNERSQFQNKDMAMKVLKSRLYEHELLKQQEENAKNQLERKSIEWGNQIRSYVFQPYTMVKDHRTNVEKGNIQAVMDGDIDDFIIAYLKEFKMKG